MRAWAVNLAALLLVAVLAWIAIEADVAAERVHWIQAELYDASERNVLGSERYVERISATLRELNRISAVALAVATAFAVGWISFAAVGRWWQRSIIVFPWLWGVEAVIRNVA